MGLELLTDAAKDEGRWFKYAEGDDGKPVEVLIVRVADEDKRRIRREVFGAKIASQANGKIVLSRSKEFDARLREGMLALRDTRGGMAVKAGDAAAAEFYQTVLSNGQVTAGQLVVLDGHWTDDVKRRIFSTAEKFLGWVRDRETELVAEADEDESGKD